MAITPSNDAKAHELENAEHLFFETLAGREKGQPVAEALRQALQEEANTIKEAHNAQLEKISEYEMARLAALKQQLFELKVFKKPGSDKYLGKIGQTSISNNIKKWFSSSNWYPGIAVTASILVAVTLLLHQPFDDGFNPNAIRGGEDLIIKTSQPQILADSLSKTLTNSGAEVVNVQINENEWVLDISVLDKDKIQIVKNVLKQNGLKNLGAPPYRIVIKQD